MLIKIYLLMRYTRHDAIAEGRHVMAGLILFTRRYDMPCRQASPTMGAAAIRRIAELLTLTIRISASRALLPILREYHILAAAANALYFDSRARSSQREEPFL